jgi:signal peptidase I
MTTSFFKGVALFFWELIKVFLFAVVIIVPIRYFLVQPFFVRGASMEPNFSNGEYLVVDELSYRFREPQRGEVVVFRFPGQPSQFFIKRIVGLPGDTVRIEEGRVVIHNKDHPEGAMLDESFYLPEHTRTGGQNMVELGENEYFVLGDNRAASSDSRMWGALPQKAIIGRTWIRAFPFDRFTFLTFERPGFINL